MDVNALILKSVWNRLDPITKAAVSMNTKTEKPEVEQNELAPANKITRVQEKRHHHHHSSGYSGPSPSELVRIANKAIVTGRKYREETIREGKQIERMDATQRIALSTKT